MKAYYADHFVLPLPDGHRFPMPKYWMLRQRILDESLMPASDLLVPPHATDEDILRCHNADYLEKVKNGTLSHREMVRIGFPWTPAMVERSRRASGATIQAALSTLTDGASANLAGGTHHAARDHGEGYCVFNDSAIAARALQAKGLVERVIVMCIRAMALPIFATMTPQFLRFRFMASATSRFAKSMGTWTWAYPITPATMTILQP
jgi:acetoin utilization deacetylase AcuC-like enzyme